MPTVAPSPHPSEATVALHEFVWKNTNVAHPNPASLRPQILEWLEKGADLNYPSLDPSQEAGYPLAVACASGSSEWVELLLELGARLDVAPRIEDVDNDHLMPSTPFDPLGRVINYLEYELEDNGDDLEDHSKGPVKILELLLAQGADPLLTDSFLGVSPFTDWFRVVGEKLDYPDLSAAQVETVVKVTDALLSALQPELSGAFIDAVIHGTTGPDTFEAEKMLEWPGVLLDAWRARKRAESYDAALPVAHAPRKPARF